MVDTMTVTREQVLTAIERERRAWDDLLAAVDAERMHEAGAMGDWCGKDLVAHLAAWEVYTLDRLEAEAEGRPAPAAAWPADRESDDEINAWLQETNRDRSLAETIGWSRETYDRLERLVAALPETDLNDPARFAELDGRALGSELVSGAYFSHLHEDHEPDLRRLIGPAS
jgi:hypothetical protein